MAVTPTPPQSLVTRVIRMVKPVEPKTNNIHIKPDCAKDNSENIDPAVQQAQLGIQIKNKKQKQIPQSRRGHANELVKDAVDTQEGNKGAFDAGEAWGGHATEKRRRDRQKRDQEMATRQLKEMDSKTVVSEGVNSASADLNQPD